MRERDFGNQSGAENSHFSTAAASGTAQPVSNGLRQVLLSARDETGRTMDELSVLSGPNEPYRLDTPSGHRDGSWLAMELDRLKFRRPVHLRGLHYILVAAGDVVRPDGQRYVNDDPTWQWMADTAAKAARWLGYVAWSDIKDERNEPPALHLAEPPARPWVGADFDIYVDLPDDISPTVYVTEFQGRQCINSICSARRQPARRASTDRRTLWRDARAADRRAELHDGAHDRQPHGGGWTSRRRLLLQRRRSVGLPDADQRRPQAAGVPRPAVPGARRADIPARPDTEAGRGLWLAKYPAEGSERRADRWKAAFGTEQTEIDALAVLRPDLLRKIAIDAIEPFFDETLHARCYKAWGEYQRQAEAAFVACTDAEMIAELRGRAETQLAELRERISSLREEMRSSLDHIRYDLGLPDPVVPEPIIKSPPDGEPIYSSAWDWAEATRRMRARKAYVAGGAV